MTGVLEGMKVVSAETVAAGPMASALMADWGADVIRIEPLTGESSRGLQRDMGVAVGNFNVRMELYNRNKKGLAVDLKKEAGINILYQLIKKSDVFLSNYEVGAIKKLKADYATLSQINPRLIYAVVTGYGTVGPDKDERGYDVTAAWARTGLMYLLGQSGTPAPVRSALMDKVASGYAVAGILGAMLHRDKTGQGQQLELSLYHIGVWISSNEIQSALVGLPVLPLDRTKATNPIWNYYRTKDDRWLELGMLVSPLHWPDFCRAIERPELENDPRFNNIETRAENCEELVRIIDEVLASRNCQEWEQRFRENNCIYGRVATPLEVTTDPQALANDFFAEIEHPTLGTVKLITSPVKFHQNPASIRTRCPEIGQDTEEILLDLDYSWEDIARLKEQEVIL